MKIVLLDAKTLGEDLNLSSLEQFGNLIKYDVTTPAQTLERINNADIVLTNKVVITADMMQACPNLKLICITATGMNNVDLEAAKTLNITVKNVAGYSTKSVAQHTFATALYLIEKLDYYNHVVKSKEWSNQSLFTDVSRPYFEISGKLWGIIGMGTIGREVAKIADAFGAEIAYHSTSGNTTQPYKHLELEEMLTTCDIISIHAPLNDQTHNLINKNNLPLLKDGAILLNMGRGGIINEEDLAVELDRRELYAGLDVLSAEPCQASHPLLDLKHPHRALITPHIAWASIEAREKLLVGVVENIQTFLNKHD